jgi:FkbM family methyltransferase
MCILGIEVCFCKNSFIIKKNVLDFHIIMTKVYFQIGTNNGNDRFRDLVLQNKPDLVILVEPNLNLLDEIKRNYNFTKNVYIYNNAVYYTNDEDITLYIPSKNGVWGARADNGLVYGDGHFSLVPMNDWGDKNDMVKISTKSITFDEICRRHNITNIEYLQIDTEGFDSEIIKMIDLTKYNIAQIRFEKWTFNPQCFTNYNSDKSNELGMNGMTNSIIKLKQHNYQLRDISDVDGNDIIATRL